MEEYEDILPKEDERNQTQILTSHTLSNPFSTNILNYSHNNSNITYDLQVMHKTEMWNIKKTLHDFQQLMESLKSLNFLFLPNLPSLSNSEIRIINKEVLDFLKYINYRFDILSNSLTSVFFTYSNNKELLSDITHLGFSQVYNFQMEKMSDMILSDFLYDTDNGILIIGLEDVSFLSSIGRFWSLIDYEILGNLLLFQRLFDKNKKPFFRKLVVKSFDARISKLDLCISKKRFFLGLDNGSLMIFNINKIDKSKNSIEEDENSLIVISEGNIFRYLSDRVTGITNSEEFLFAIGKDNKLVVVNKENNKLLFSGSLKKRVEGKGHVNSILYDEKSCKLFISTIVNIVLIYKVNSNILSSEDKKSTKKTCSVEFVIEFSCDTVIKDIYVCNTNLVLGQDTQVQIINFNNQDINSEFKLISFDGKLDLETSNSSKYLILKYYLNSISAICYMTKSKMLILGLSDGGLVVYSLHSFEVIFAKRICSSKIIKLILLEENEVVLAGDELGNIGFFNFGT